MHNQKDMLDSNQDDMNEEINEQERNSLFNSLSAQLSDYIISRPIGSGAGSLVVQVQSIKTKKEYAIKVVDKQSSYYKSAYKRLKNEIEVHLDLKHKNIVKMIKSFEDQENLYLVMEYCEGGDLFHYLKHHKKLSENEAKRITFELAEGLKYLHDKSIIHRDLKLGNVLLSSEHVVKVCDFGLAARLDGNEQEKNTICGTPNYISPEILNKQPYGMKIDCWSFGCILYALIVGHPPFQGQDVVQTLKKVTSQEQFFDLPTNISSNLKDLLINIINWNQDSRFTIDQILQHPFYEDMRQKSAKQRQEEEESLSFFNSIRSVKGDDQRINVHQNGIKKIDVKYQDNFFNQLENNNNPLKKKSCSPNAHTNVADIQTNNKQTQMKSDKMQQNNQCKPKHQIDEVNFEGMNQMKRQSTNNLTGKMDKPQGAIHNKDINYARKNSPVDRNELENQQNRMNKQSEIFNSNINNPQSNNRIKDNQGQNYPSNMQRKSSPNEHTQNKNLINNFPDKRSMQSPHHNSSHTEAMKSPKLTQNQQDVKQTFMNNIERIKGQPPLIPPNQQQTNAQQYQNTSANLGNEKKQVRSVIYNNHNNTVNGMPPQSNTSGISTQQRNAPAYSGYEKSSKTNIRNNSPVNTNMPNQERKHSPKISQNPMSHSTVLNSNPYQQQQIQQQQQIGSHKNNSYSITQNKANPLPERVSTNLVHNLNSLNDIDRHSPPHNNHSANTTTNVKSQHDLNNFAQPSSTVSHNRTKKQVSFENKTQLQPQPQMQKIMQNSDSGFYKKSSTTAITSQTSNIQQTTTSTNQNNMQRKQSPQQTSSKPSSDNLNYYLTKKDNPQYNNNNNYEEFKNKYIQENTYHSARVKTEQTHSLTNASDYSSTKINTENYNSNRLNTDYNSSNSKIDYSNTSRVNTEQNTSRNNYEYHTNNGSNNKNTREYASNRISTEYGNKQNQQEYNKQNGADQQQYFTHRGENGNNTNMNKLSMDNIQNRINTENSSTNLITENNLTSRTHATEQGRSNENTMQKNMQTIQQTKSLEKKQKSEVPMISQIPNQPMRSSQVQLTQNQMMQQKHIPLSFFTDDRGDSHKKTDKFEKAKHYKNQVSDNTHYSQTNNTNSNNYTNLSNQNNINTNEGKEGSSNKEGQYKQPQQDTASKYQKVRVNTQLNCDLSSSIEQLNSPGQIPNQLQRPSSQTKIEIPNNANAKSQILSKQTSNGASRQITERGISKSISNMVQFTSQQNLHTNASKNMPVFSSPNNNLGSKLYMQNYALIDPPSNKQNNNNNTNLNNFASPQHNIKSNLENKNNTERRLQQNLSKHQNGEDISLASYDNAADISRDDASSRGGNNIAQIASKTHKHSNHQISLTQQSYQGAIRNIEEGKSSNVFNPNQQRQHMSQSGIHQTNQIGVAQSLQVQTFRYNNQNGYPNQIQPPSVSNKMKLSDMQELYKSQENQLQANMKRNNQQTQQQHQYSETNEQNMFTNYLQEVQGLKMYEQYQSQNYNSIDEMNPPTINSVISGTSCGSSNQTLSKAEQNSISNTSNMSNANIAKPYLPHQLLQNNINKRQQKIASADSTACTNASTQFLLQAHQNQAQQQQPQIIGAPSSLQNNQSPPPHTNSTNLNQYSSAKSYQRSSVVQNSATSASGVHQSQIEVPQNHYYLKNSTVMISDSNFTSPMQGVKSKSRIQNCFKTEASDCESNSVQNQNNTINTLDYYESPRLNTLNLLLSPDRRPETNNSTATKTSSQMKTLLSANKESSTKSGNSNNTSKYSRLSPLKVGRIPTKQVPIQNGTIEITDNREFILKQTQKNFTMIISSDGREITLIKDDEPQNRRVYTIERLPDKYIQFYDYCKKICQSLSKNVQDKSPKVKLENEDGQFFLYDNKFEGLFTNGYIVTYKINSQTLDIQTNKYAPKILFDLQKDLKHASKEMKLLVQKTQKIVSIITSMKS